MKYRVIEGVLCLWLLLSCFSVLNTPYVENALLLLAPGLFYFTAAFGVIRRLNWVRYLMYVNLAAVVVVSAVALSFAGVGFFPKLIIPLTLSLFAAFYCRRRYRNPDRHIKVKRELCFYLIGLVLFSAVLVVLSLFIEPTVRNISGPISIRKH